MDDLEFFELDGPVSEDQARFLGALRPHVEGRYYLTIDPSPDGRMMIALDVVAPGVVLLTVGAYLQDGRLSGDRMDSQLYELPDRPTDMALDVTGAPGDLAGQAAEWFEAILRRPIVRYEWLHRGRVYAHRYLFADTGQGLAQMYRDDYAPLGQRERLIAAGHVRGMGWLDTRGLGEPDRVITISGDI